MLSTIPLTAIERPRIALRPVRRESLEYNELVESVAKDGVLQPILVRPLYCSGCEQKECTASCTISKVDGYQIVEGWHRYEAAKEAGLSEIPCLVREMSDEQVMIFQLKCNTIRPLTYSFEFARRLKKLMEDGYSLPQLSKLIDKSQKWIKDQIHLNRLCGPARKPTESGEIELRAALALANLPEELQVKFVDDAISMPTKEFVDRAEAANRDFKQYLLEERERNRKIGAAKPCIRAVNVMRREALEPKHAHNVLKAMDAKTAIEGWEACLAWAFQLDPISVERRLQGAKETVREKQMKASEYRKTNRELIKKFINPQSHTGDYQHG